MDLYFGENDPRKTSLEKLIEQNKATQAKIFSVSLVLVGFLLGWTLCYFSYTNKPACYTCAAPGSGPLFKSLNQAKHTAVR